MYEALRLLLRYGATRYLASSYYYTYASVTYVSLTISTYIYIHSHTHTHTLAGKAGPAIATPPPAGDLKLLAYAALSY